MCVCEHLPNEQSSELEEFFGDMYKVNGGPHKVVFWFADHESSSAVIPIYASLRYDAYKMYIRIL